MIYKAQEEDPSRTLDLGSKFAFAWTTAVNMKSDYLKGSVSSSVGVITVEWQPTQLKYLDGVVANGTLNPMTAHGPLVLQTPCTCRFMGPPCYVENAPFETSVEGKPAVPRTAVPFEVVYYIKNKTTVQQKLKVVMDDSVEANGEGSNFLITGLINGEICLEPLETRVLSYTALPLKAGPVWLPKLSVSSDRYKTWVIREDSKSDRSLIVLP